MDLLGSQTCSAVPTAFHLQNTSSNIRLLPILSSEALNKARRPLSTASLDDSVGHTSTTAALPFSRKDQSSSANPILSAGNLGRDGGIAEAPVTKDKEKKQRKKTSEPQTEHSEDGFTNL